MSHLSLQILESFAEGRLPSSDQAAHLQSCRECAAQVEKSAEYFSLMKSLPRLKAPPGFSTRLRARLEAEAAVPGWKKFLSALFSTRRIPLQLAGAGFAALLLFWALPRQQNPVPQSETEAGKGRPLSSPDTLEVLEAPAVIETEAGVKGRVADEKESRPEPLRLSIPKKRASVKSELPKTTAPRPSEAPASRQAAAPVLSKSESRSAPRMEESLKSLADESQAEDAPSPAMSQPPSSDAQLRALGFHKEIRNGREIHILRLEKSQADSVQARLKDLGLEKLLILHDLRGDSLEIEIR